MSDHVKLWFTAKEIDRRKSYAASSRHTILIHAFIVDSMIQEIILRMRHGVQ